jgi:zinc transporter ZupT
LTIAAAFAIPTIVSLTIVRGAAKLVSPRYIAGFALGIYFWFFSDTLGDSAYLGLNSGFAGGIPQALLILLYLAGIMFVFTVDGKSFIVHGDGDSPNFIVPILVAIAIGIHGLGEGAAFSTIAASTPSQDFLSAFGGLSPAIAFVLHKALEPVMVGAAYVAYARAHATSPRGALRDLVVLSLVFILPGLVGAATAYSLSYDTTYVFAFCLGTSFYAPVRIAKAFFVDRQPSRWDSAKVATAIALGLLSLYFAALLHS